MQRISDQDIKAFEPRNAWNKKVSFVHEVMSSDSDEEQKVDVLSFWPERSREICF